MGRNFFKVLQLSLALLLLYQRISRSRMSRISGLRNDMNKRIFYKERKINNSSFDFLSKQNKIVPLILDINERVLGTRLGLSVLQRV